MRENGADFEQIKKELGEKAAAENIPIIRGTERELLLRAASLVQPRKILEIGTAVGYSALLLAERFPFSETDTIEIDEKRYKTALEVMKRAGLQERVHCHFGDASSLISTLQGPYDFVFLDGPKGQYLKHLQMIEPLLAGKAVIAADNVLFRGLVRMSGTVEHRYRTIVVRLREYLSYVEKNYNTVIYEEGDGLAVSVRKEKGK